jgi:hypothetical protein
MHKNNKYDSSHVYDWNDTIEIFSNSFLTCQGIKTMNYCASVVYENGNIGGTVDECPVGGKKEPFVVRMYILESLLRYEEPDMNINLDVVINEIKQKMAVVVQTIWLKDKTINKMVPFVRGLDKKTYCRMVGLMNATTKEQIEEVYRIYEKT